MTFDQLLKASPSDLAVLLSGIKAVAGQKDWIRKTQMVHIDLMLNQLYRKQAAIMREKARVNR